MENKVKYNLISSLLLIFMSAYTYLKLVYSIPSNYIGIFILWIASYLLAGILGLINLDGQNRKLTRVSAIILLVLTAIQFIAFIAFMVIAKMMVMYLFIYLILLLALTGIGTFYAISELTGKKVFLIIALGIIGFLLSALQIALFVVMSRVTSITDFLRYYVVNFEMIGISLLFLLGAILFKLLAYRKS